MLPPPGFNVNNIRLLVALCLLGSASVLGACRAEPASPDELEAAAQVAEVPAPEGSDEARAAASDDQAMIDELKKQESEDTATLQRTIEAAAVQAGAGTLRPIDPNTLGVRRPDTASATMRPIDSGNLRLQTNQLRLQRTGQQQLQHRLTLTPAPTNGGAAAPATTLRVGQ